MNRTLRLYLPPTWPHPADTHWVLLNDDGKYIDEGCSGPSRWPVAETCEAVLSASQTSRYGVSAPARMPRTERSGILAYALEERLLGDIANQHLTEAGRAGTDIQLLVVAKDRIRRVISALTELGHPPARLFSELQAVPDTSDVWHLAIGYDGAILCGNGFSIPMEHASVDLPPLLTSTLGKTDTGRPLHLHIAPGLPLPDTGQWSALLERQVMIAEPHHWHHLPAIAANLLHGDFQPHHLHSMLLDRLKPALRLAGTVLVLNLIIILALMGWKKYQLFTTQKHIEALFQQVAPHTPVIDAPLQLTRYLDSRRVEAGLLRSDDALALLAALAEALGADARDAARSIHYQEGVLDVELAPALAPRIPGLIEQLEMRGLTVIPGKGTRLNLRRGK
ncbi:MAG: hypothetical protein JSR19_11040 [Proteobacteria bacterium]|nr:hypothetical protein [Pseudomonadota bacterium]HQR02578.1 type II secretion system protein GspL [Rhodocyclaceae bacterium]